MSEPELLQTDTFGDGVPADFEEIKKKAEALYASIGEINCPYLKRTVIFNAKGLEHLKFQKKNHARPRKDQYIRLKLLKLASPVIQESKTLQGINERKVFEVNRSNHRNEKILVGVTYFEFVAVIERRVRVRVIVKQVGEAPPYFWSIIPFWKRQKLTGQRKMHYGDPESD